LPAILTVRNPAIDIRKGFVLAGKGSARWRCAAKTWSILRLLAAPQRLL
jgi:hypothetical protein